MTFLWTLLHLAVLGSIAAALIRPALRRPVAAGIAAAGLLAAAGAVATGGTAERRLVIEHAFATFEDAEVRIGAFPVDEAAAPAFAWGLLVLAFCGAWALWLRRAAPPRDARRDGPEHAVGAGVGPVVGPLTLGWSALALGLLLEQLAAPEGLVRPLSIDRALFPAAVTAAVLLPYRLRRVGPVLAWLSVFVAVARLPVVVFGTAATANEWGTSLDVHTITLFANPLAQLPVEVVRHSVEQLWWLLWAPHLLVMPGIYMLSLTGIAFAVTMFLQHPGPGAQRGSAGAGSGTR